MMAALKHAGVIVWNFIRCGLNDGGVEGRVGLEPTQTGLRDRRTLPRLHTAHLVRGLGFEPRKSRILKPACLPVASAAHFGGPARNRTGFSAFGEPSAVHERDQIRTKFLRGALTAKATRIAAAPWAAASFRLFLEACHGFGVGPAGAGQIVVVLVAVFAQPASHVTFCLMATHGASVHDWLHLWRPAQVLTLARLV
jgi:hypothetical protein